MKKKQIKRTLVQTKKGIKPFYFEGGKRVRADKGRLKWIQQNYDNLDKPYSKQPKNLTAEEIKTFNRKKSQEELFRYKGKPIDKFMVEVLKGRGAIPLDTKERDILKLKDKEGNNIFRSYGQFEQIFDIAKRELFQTQFTSLMGAAGHRGRTRMESAISIVEGLQIIGYKGWKLEVVLPNGDVVYGINKGLEQIRIFEESETERRTERDRNIAAVRFTYTFEWDTENKVLSINLWSEEEGGGVLIEEMRS
jgi:hypothetical protein